MEKSSAMEVFKCVNVALSDMGPVVNLPMLGQQLHLMILKAFPQYKKVNGEAFYSKIDSNLIHLEGLKAFLGHWSIR